MTNELAKNKKQLDYLLNNRSFIIPSFEIYGGVSGFYDLGPPACNIKNNIISHWRKTFIVEEDMQQIECSNITPESVLKSSGHIDKFTDIVIKDVKTGRNYRADKLLQDVIDYILENDKLSDKEITEYQIIRSKAESYSCEDLDTLLAKKFKHKLVHYLEDSEIEFDVCKHLNLMFKTSTGSDGKNISYLRPETAQGIFVNFNRLYASNGSKMPFAVAQIGTGFRNEIAPRNSLLRVREFCMAEIEHFVDPENKSHVSFNEVSKTHVTLLPRTEQIDNSGIINISLREAVSNKIIDNETLAYYIYKTNKFLMDIGIKPNYLRFRQHLNNEMAHYAADCWDAEIFTSHGWIECVGIADRSCYDLVQHAKATKSNIHISEPLEKPVSIKYFNFKINKKLIFKIFGKIIGNKNCDDFCKHLETHLDDPLNIDEVIKVFSQNKDYNFEYGDFMLPITGEMLEITAKTKKITTRQYIPSVIEPSFGIGRILYALFEHSFHVPTLSEDSDAARVTMRFKSLVAPFKCAIIPLIQKNTDMKLACNSIAKILRHKNINCKIDSSGSAIGKRYARFDEIGIPYTITVDYDTITKSNNLFNSVTIRERDSRLQCRVDIASITQILLCLSKGEYLFESLVNDELDIISEQ